MKIDKEKQQVYILVKIKIQTYENDLLPTKIMEILRIVL